MVTVSDCVRFFGFWVMQMMWVWVVSLPIMVVNSVQIDTPLGVSDYAGIAMFSM